MLRRMYFSGLSTFALLALLSPSMAVAQFTPQPFPKFPFPPIQGLPPDLEKQMKQFEKDLMELEKAFDPLIVQQGAGLGPAVGGGAEVRWGGVKLKKADAAQQQKLGLPDNEGLIVAAVDANSPADKAGLKVNDVLVKVNDTAVSNDFTLFAKMVKEQKADEPLDLIVVRQGKEEMIKGAKMPAVAQATPPGGEGGRIQIRQGGGLFVPRIQIPPLVRPRFPNPNPMIPFKLEQAENLNLELSVNGTKVSRKQTADQFSGEYSKDNLKITVKGSINNGEPTITEIVVQEGVTSNRYTKLQEVPAQYRSTIQQTLLPSSNNLILPQGSR